LEAKIISKHMNIFFKIQGLNL